MTKSSDLSTILQERAAVIVLMKKHNLALSWLKETSIPQLTACCERMDSAHLSEDAMNKTLQYEMINNPAFAAYYAKLLPMLPDEPPEKSVPIQFYGSRYYQSSSRPEQPSRRTILKTRLYDLLKRCRTYGWDLTVYPQEQLMATLELDLLSDDTRLIFLENFAPIGLSDKAQQTVINSMQYCKKIPLKLTEQQKTLLLEPFVSTRHLFLIEPFNEIANLLNDHPALLDIIRLMHDMNIREELSLTNYTRFSQNTAEYYRLLQTLLGRLGTDAGSSFMKHWQRNGCTLCELQTMEKWAREQQGSDWMDQIETYSGYANLLYGSRYKRIDLAHISPYQEDILVFAIVHNKKHFIRLVDEHAEMFLDLSSASVLFQEKLYQEHFNVNELTERDLAECARMSRHGLNAEHLSPGRRYTFPELRALYDAPDHYLAFYHRLKAGSQDYRLKVFRQVRKRDILQPNLEDAELSALAAALDIKPLDDWMRKDFGHISDLTAGDSIQILINLDKLRHLLASIETRTDALLALRSLDTLEQYASITELKGNLPQTDTDWHALVEHMALTPDFQQQHRGNIIRFLCSNGAYIAETYYKHLADWQQEAYLRVVKAELMGKLEDLKYFEGDLQRELNSPLTSRVKTGWRVNTSVTKNGLEAREHDDFFSTMLLGTQPQRTCLSYIDGVYNECLLSSFDSNKKILYATFNGCIVGRAFLRLTKGRLTNTVTQKKAEDKDFTFVDLENIEESRSEKKREGENLTLFLERPYICGVGPEVRQQIMSLFVELAERKADELGTMLVLSTDYRELSMSGFTWTCYAIYISKSKAGAQYLDSLGGQATVSAEDSYKTNNFLVREIATALRKAQSIS